MKILTGIDVPFRPFGGSLLYCDDLYSDLPEDVEVRFLTLHPPEVQAKWWNMKDVVFLDVEKQYGPEAFPGYTAALREAVEEQVADFQPDIIHSQHLNYGLSRVFADMAEDIPKIGICHGTDVQIATQFPFFRDNLNRICDNMDALVFPNQNMLDDFNQVYDGTATSLINPLGIPDKYYEYQDKPVTFDGQRTLRVLYAGRLLNWKGADVAVQAMAHVKHDVSLTVIGNEDEKGYKDSMLQFVAGNKLQDKVRFIEQLDREELFKTFGEYDVIVFPSKGVEAFSLTLIEAQIHGLPVMAADSGGIVNTMGGSGLLITDNTPETWARELDNIYGNPSTLQDLQRHGYANAENYRLSLSQQKLFDISRQLIRDYRPTVSSR
jgi:glycosyltransferase involved in cell wall biosynthesis